MQPFNVSPYKVEKLSSSQVVAVVVRLFSVGLAIYAIRYTGGWITFYEEYPPQELFLYLATGLFVPLFIAAFLWRFPLFIASRLIKGDGTSIDHEPLTAKAAYCVGFVLLGFLLLFWTISDLVYWLVFFFNASRLDDYYQTTLQTAEPLASFIATLVELVLALYLIVGAKKLAAFFHKLRHEY